MILPLPFFFQDWTPIRSDLYWQKKHQDTAWKGRALIMFYEVQENQNTFQLYQHWLWPVTPTAISCWGSTYMETMVDWLGTWCCLKLLRAFVPADSISTSWYLGFLKQMICTRQIYFLVWTVGEEVINDELSSWIMGVLGDLWTWSFEDMGPSPKIWRLPLPQMIWRGQVTRCWNVSGCFY